MHTTSLLPVYPNTRKLEEKGTRRQMLPCFNIGINLYKRLLITEPFNSPRTLTLRLKPPS